MASRAHRGAAGLMLAGLLGLAACGASPEAEAPALTADQALIAGVEGPLALSRWTPDGPPRAVLLALHGYGEYAPTAFEEAATSWAEGGVLVYAYDQRGFGRNPSNRRWAGAEAMIADAAAAAADAAGRHPDLPLFVAGVSMGGAVALSAAGEDRLPPATRGLILLAPALWGGDSLSPLYRASAWLAAKLTPDTRFSARSSPVRIRPTDNWDMLRRVSADPLRFANPSPREFQGLIRLMDRAVEAAPTARLDTLTVIGEKDEVIPPQSVRAAHDRLPEPKTFAYVPTAWHMLLRDLEAETVHDLVLNWMLERAE
ncbi:MAG: alpha/beta fold hydrolase [Pseudomonadota bacterium]